MDSRRMEAAASAQSYRGFALCLPITDEFPMAALVHHLLTRALSSQVLSVSQDSLHPHPFSLLELFPNEIGRAHV